MKPTCHFNLHLFCVINQHPQNPIVHFSLDIAKLAHIKWSEATIIGPATLHLIRIHPSLTGKQNTTIFLLGFVKPSYV